MNRKKKKKNDKEEEENNTASHPSSFVGGKGMILTLINTVTVWCLSVSAAVPLKCQSTGWILIGFLPSCVSSCERVMQELSGSCNKKHHDDMVPESTLGKTGHRKVSMP